VKCRGAFTGSVTRDELFCISELCEVAHETKRGSLPILWDIVGREQVRSLWSQARGGVSASAGMPGLRR
jgi:hypothetical protein